MPVPSHYPLLHVPTPGAKTAFLRALYAKGWNWCGFDLDGALSDIAVYAYDRYAYASLTEYGQILFIADDEVVDIRRDEPEYRLTAVNSPAQFLAYGAPIWREHNVDGGDAGDDGDDDHVLDGNPPW